MQKLKRYLLEIAINNFLAFVHKYTKTVSVSLSIENV